MTVHPHSRSSFYTALLVAFIDTIGVGLIYPIFSAILFDPTLDVLPPEASQKTRGLWLGILIAIMPFAQFFSSPLWGSLSDNHGRKKPLLISLTISLLGYLFALMGVIFSSIFWLLSSRLIIGIASGNMSIVQATVADLSSPQEKAKNFGLYSMAIGAGFTLGPFFGGVLSTWSYSIPFHFASFIIILNILFALIFFKETHHPTFRKKIEWHSGITQLKKAFHYYGMRTILLVSFIHNFGWSYFFEFVPVYLIKTMQFGSRDLGFFYGTAGSVYALTTGVLIRPFVSRFKPETLFFGGNFLTSLAIMTMALLPSPGWIWLCLILLCFFVAFVSPTSTTLVSNHASPQIQGEALGVLSAVNAASLALSPLLSGSIVGSRPSYSMWIGGSVMLFGALLILAVFRRRLLGRIH